MHMYALLPVASGRRTIIRSIIMALLVPITSTRYTFANMVVCVERAKTLDSKS